MPVSAIRGVTFVEPRAFADYVPDLIAALPQIKAIGFNTVELALPWMQFEVAPLAVPPVYHEPAFRALRTALDAIGRQHMRAILMLNMLGPGWAPVGIDPCIWFKTPVMEHAFESYVTEFMKRILPYHDLVYLMVLTESTQYCDPQQYQHAKQLAVTLQTTIGALPAHLPQNLRSQFQFGYQDNSLVALNWAKGVSPIASPDPFDFLSSTVYGLEQKTNAQIETELAARVGRFKKIDQNVPIIFGEFGASRCYGTAVNQARVETDITSWAMKYAVGFNVWHWKPAPDEDACQLRAYPGLAITNSDGSLTPAALALQALLNP
jgi:hypothetical protein